jgi:aryl-alcohol dehydrogenase-like predicted oxidoreductase
LEETLRTLDDLVTAGKVRYIGASNYAAWELAKALGLSDRYRWTRFVSSQVSYSLADRTPELEMVPLCLDQGLGLIAYFPLAGGILTGKYRQPQLLPSGSRAEKDPHFAQRLDQSRLDLAHRVREIAAERGTTPAGLALAWLVRQPAVASAIVGATRVEQVEENLQALEVAWDATVAAALDDASQAFRYAPPFAVYRLGPEHGGTV